MRRVRARFYRFTCVCESEVEKVSPRKATDWRARRRSTAGRDEVARCATAGRSKEKDMIAV